MSIKYKIDGIDLDDLFVKKDLFDAGNLWLCGYNNYGQLGDNSIVKKSSPVQTIAGGTNWKSISARTYHTAGIKTDGTLWTWGNNGFGQLGNNTIVNKSSPAQTIAGGTNWKSVVAGYYYTAAISDSSGF